MMETGDEETNWAKHFLASLEEHESQVVYAVPAEWWNDFYCYMLIMQEGNDIEIEGAGEFLSKKNCFNNQSLINEKQFKDRRQAHLQMQDMTKDHIKTLQDYFSLDLSKSINEDYCLIGSKPYELIQQTTSGGPHIRLFVSNSSEQKNTSKTLLDVLSPAACLSSDQFIDMDLIQVGLIVKNNDKAQIEYGYYPKHMAFMTFWSVAVRYIEDAQTRKTNLTIYQRNGENFTQNKTIECGLLEQTQSLDELGIHNGDIAVLALDSFPDQDNKENHFLEEEADWGLDKIVAGQANDFMEGLQLDGIIPSNYARLPLVSNQQNDKNDNQNSSIAGDEEETVDNLGEDSRFGLRQHNSRMDQSTEESEGFSLSRNVHIKGRNNNSFNQDGDHNDHMNSAFIFNQEKQQGLIACNANKNNFGVARTQDEIDSVCRAVNLKIDKAGQMQLPCLTVWESIRNISQMVRQLGGEIKEHNQQRAKQEQAEQIEMIISSEKQERMLLMQQPLQLQQGTRQENRQRQGEEDSCHTSSTSTQSENDDSHHTKNFTSSSNTHNNLFDHSNILDADQIN